MKVDGATALVTGAGRGIGRAFVEELLQRDARRVYSAVRDPESEVPPGAIRLPLDIKDPAMLLSASVTASDVDLLVNIAGTDSAPRLLQGDLGRIRRDLETNFFGTLMVTRAFSDVVGRNGGGAVVNVLSARAWTVGPGTGSVSASEVAEWGLTLATRAELANQGTLITGVFSGVLNTDVGARWKGPRLDPRTVASAALDGVNQDLADVLVGDSALELQSVATAFSGASA